MPIRKTFSAGSFCVKVGSRLACRRLLPNHLSPSFSALQLPPQIVQGSFQKAANAPAKNHSSRNSVKVETFGECNPRSEALRSFNCGPMGGSGHSLLPHYS